MIAWLARVLPWPHPPAQVLAAYWDGECGRLVAKTVKAHLRGCRQCQETAAVHRLMVQSLDVAASLLSAADQAQMLAEGRANLLRRASGPQQSASKPKRLDRGEAELIFGCRRPAGSSSDADQALELMYATLLGSRVRGDRRHR